MLAVSPMTSFQPDVFSAELIRLRTDAHLSQRTLARWSGVSNTAISALEAGDAPAPHPSMLSKLARGLATSGYGVIDDRKSETAYLALMRAAGYMPAALAQAAVIDWREALMAKGFRPDQSHIVDQILDDMTSKRLNDHQRDQVLSAVTSMLEALRVTSPER